MKAHSVGREAVLGRRSGACARGRPLPDQVLESGRFWVKADLSSGSAAKDLQRLTRSGNCVGHLVVARRRVQVRTSMTPIMPLSS